MHHKTALNLSTFLGKIRTRIRSVYGPYLTPLSPVLARWLIGSKRASQSRMRQEREEVRREFEKEAPNSLT